MPVVAGRMFLRSRPTMFDSATRGMRPSKTVGAASRVVGDLIDCHRRTVLAGSNER